MSQPQEQPQGVEEREAPQAEETPEPRKAGKATLGKLQGAANRAGATPEQLAQLAVAAGADSLETLTMTQAREVKGWLESKGWLEMI